MASMDADLERIGAAMEKRRRKLAAYCAAHPDPRPFVVRHNWQAGYRGTYTGDGAHTFPPPYDPTP